MRPLSESEEDCDAALSRLLETLQETPDGSLARLGPRQLRVQSAALRSAAQRLSRIAEEAAPLTAAVVAAPLEEAETPTISLVKRVTSSGLPARVARGRDHVAQLHRERVVPQGRVQRGGTEDDPLILDDDDDEEAVIADAIRQAGGAEEEAGNESSSPEARSPSLEEHPLILDDDDDEEEAGGDEGISVSASPEAPKEVELPTLKRGGGTEEDALILDDDDDEEAGQTGADEEISANASPSPEARSSSPEEDPLTILDEEEAGNASSSAEARSPFPEEGPLILGEEEEEEEDDAVIIEDAIRQTGGDEEIAVNSSCASRSSSPAPCSSIIDSSVEDKIAAAAKIAAIFGSDEEDEDDEEEEQGFRAAPEEEQEGAPNDAVVVDEEEEEEQGGSCASPGEEQEGSPNVAAIFGSDEDDDDEDDEEEEQEGFRAADAPEEEQADVVVDDEAEAEADDYSSEAVAVTAVEEEEEEHEDDEKEDGEVPCCFLLDIVEAEWHKDKKWYQGVVTADLGNGWYQIKYNDGDTADLPARLIRRLAGRKRNQTVNSIPGESLRCQSNGKKHSSIKKIKKKDKPRRTFTVRADDDHADVEEEYRCSVCGKDEHHKAWELLLCDGEGSDGEECGTQTHSSCLGIKVPEGEWYCSCCAPKQEEEKAPFSIIPRWSSSSSESLLRQEDDEATLCYVLNTEDVVTGTLQRRGDVWLQRLAVGGTLLLPLQQRRSSTGRLNAAAASLVAASRVQFCICGTDDHGDDYLVCASGSGGPCGGKCHARCCKGAAHDFCALCRHGSVSVFSEEEEEAQRAKMPLVGRIVLLEEKDLLRVVDIEGDFVVCAGLPSSSYVRWLSLPEARAAVRAFESTVELPLFAVHGEAQATLLFSRWMADSTGRPIEALQLELSRLFVENRDALQLLPQTNTKRKRKRRTAAKSHANNALAERNESCPICFEAIPAPSDSSTSSPDVALLRCGHACCADCFQRYVSYQEHGLATRKGQPVECPLCRKMARHMF